MASAIDRRLFLGGAAALGLLPQAAWAKASAAFPSVQALLDGWVTDRKIAGSSTALSYHGAPLAYVNSGTLALGSAVAVDEDTLWRIYSMSKPITAACAMMLIEDGKIALDQPVADVLPAFRNLTVAPNYRTSLAATPARNAMTMRHLLTHTAGLSYDIAKDGVLRDAYDAQGISPALNGAALRDAGVGPQAQGLADMVARVARLPLMAEPGTVWHYSIGLDVMGAVIEAVSGKGLDVFMKRRLFDPLGMASTGFRVAPKDFGRYASNYYVTPKGLQPIDAPPGGFADPPAMLSGGGGLVSSARDYARFGRMLLGGGQLDGTRVLKSETVALMTSNLLPAGVAGPDGAGFGAGGRVVIPGTPGGSPIGSYGWGGAAGTLFSIDPAKAGLMVFMTQYMPAEAYPIRPELSRAIIQDLTRGR